MILCVAGGKGRTAQTILCKRFGCMPAGGIGSKVRALLPQSDVTIVAGVPAGKPEQVAAAYRNGTLQRKYGSEVPREPSCWRMAAASASRAARSKTRDTVTHVPVRVHRRTLRRWAERDSAYAVILDADATRTAAVPVSLSNIGLRAPSNARADAGLPARTKQDQIVPHTRSLLGLRFRPEQAH